MRLEQYIKEDSNYENEGRSVSLDLPKASAVFHKSCKEAYENPHRIVRGVSSAQRSDFLFVEPKKFTRVSRNTFNFYTLLMDNSPKWKEYPKRSQSIICSSYDNYNGDFHYSMSFGRTFIVFPFNGANIGVCSSTDIWGSFAKSGLGELADINYCIEGLARSVGLQKSLRQAETNYDKLMKLLRDIDEKRFDIDEKRFDIDINNEKLKNWNIFVKKGYLEDKDLTLMDIIEKLLDPNVNGFKHQKISQFNPASTEDVEVWTDAPSLLINANRYERLIKELINYR